MTSQCVCCEKCSYQGPGTGSLLLHRAFPAIMSDWLLWKRSFKRLLQLWTAAILHNLYRLKRQRLLGILRISKVYLKRNPKLHSCILSSTLNMSPNCPTHLAWVPTFESAHSRSWLLLVCHRDMKQRFIRLKNDWSNEHKTGCFNEILLDLWESACYQSPLTCVCLCAMLSWWRKHRSRHCRVQRICRL